MKKRTPFLVFATAVVLTATALNATGGVKKNEPKDAEKILEEIGGIHFIEGMKVDDIGSVNVKDKQTEDETFFHAYASYANDKYRVIIFDNTPNYLGYYETNLEPFDFEEGAIMLGDSESPTKIRLPIKGPSEKISIDGTLVKFVKNEKAEADKKAEAEAAKTAVASNEPITPEYREWVLINRGQKVPVEAIYVKQIGNKVTLKKKSDGRSKDFPLSMLSSADKEYVKKLK